MDRYEDACAGGCEGLADTDNIRPTIAAWCKYVPFGADPLLLSADAIDFTLDGRSFPLVLRSTAGRGGEGAAYL